MIEQLQHLALELPANLLELLDKVGQGPPEGQSTKYDVIHYRYYITEENVLEYWQHIWYQYRSTWNDIHNDIIVIMGTFARVVHCVLQGPAPCAAAPKPAASIYHGRPFGHLHGIQWNMWGSQYSSVSKSLAVAISTPGLKVSVTGKKD